LGYKDGDRLFVRTFDRKNTPEEDENTKKANAAMQKQVADLALSTQQQIAKLEQRMEVGFANVETKFTKIEGDIATLSTEVKNFKKSMTEMTTGARSALLWSVNLHHYFCCWSSGQTCQALLVRLT
jgi:hypothetical protein